MSATLALALGGSALSALGQWGQARANRRLRKDANNFRIDTSAPRGLYDAIGGMNVGQQAVDDARLAGFGYKQQDFDQQGAFRGAGRNAYGSLRNTWQQAAQNRFGSQVMGRLGQLRQQKFGMQSNLLSMIQSGREMEGQVRANAFGNIAANRNQRYGQLDGFGSGLMGMAAARHLGFQNYGPYFRQPEYFGETTTNGPVPA